MTKQEYIAKQQTMQRGVNKRLIVWMVALSGGIFAVISLSNYIEHHEDATWIGWAFLIGFCVLLLLTFVLLIRAAKRLQSEFGIKCLNCGKYIVSSQVAIATGNCGFCGEKLFDDPSAG